MHKEFRGGGLRGSWGWGLRSNLGAPFLYVYVLFWGLSNVFPNGVAVGAVGGRLTGSTLKAVV